MKKYIKYLGYVVLAYVVIQRAPGIYKNFMMQNKSTSEYSVLRLSGEEITFPLQNQKVIVIFWATWCKPCKVELNKINSLFAKGEIKSNQFLAINVRESKATVLQFLKDNPWQFTIALDEAGSISEKYNVSGTPTVVFIDKNSKINWISTGLSYTLEYRIKNFLKN